ncbi:DUF4349 domain-containing protein [Leucobacter ruminantium]|uniref:DUF4349 domain-containing protein n=1 Tax=Leucobacter ruminantium TaxID=1289170 RepID=A0A939RTG2_9MICO|nr:DUF4349 domain-containing protein [Leucobacter ruminantium]MBO1804230.1 DUF4349 domain-containing protein [Leucobacter ruminantium]
MSRRTQLRALSAAAAAGLLLIPLSACAAGGSSGAPDFAASESAVSPDQRALDGATAEAPADPSSAAEKSVVRTGSLTIEVANPEAAADDAAAAMTDLDGSVESLEVRQEGEGSTAWLTVRVPADKLDEAFEALGEIGDVVSESRSAVDVTTEHVDLEARVGALKASVERLEQLMSNSASTSELLEAESALSQRQQELDGLRAQLTALEGQVEKATIQVSLSSKSALPGGGPANFWEGLLAGFSSLGAAASGALVVLGVLLPWLVVAGVVALVVVLLVRGIRGRRARRRAAASAPPVEGASEGAASAG